MSNQDSRRFWSWKTAQITPYIPGEQPADTRLIKLNTNENPYDPAPEVIDAVKSVEPTDFRLYPDPENRRLRQVLSDYYGVSEDCLFIGNGSDEVLAMAFQAFFTARQASGERTESTATLYFPDITYSFYPVYAEIYDIPYQTFALRDDLILNPADVPVDGTGLVLANPNAPTGRAVTLQDIQMLLNANHDRLVLVDEAYIDFGGESAIALLPDFDNLLVVQTLSKSRGLAGLRVGCAIGSPALIEGLRRIRDSFNSYTVDRIAQKAAVAAVQAAGWFERTRAAIIATREWFSTELEQLGFTVIPSSANFVFVSHPEYPAGWLQNQLRQQHILVRRFNHARISEYLRISIGQQEEMELVLAVLRDLCLSPPPSGQSQRHPV